MAPVRIRRDPRPHARRWGVGALAGSAIWVWWWLPRPGPWVPAFAGTTVKVREGVGGGGRLWGLPRRGPTMGTASGYGMTGEGVTGRVADPVAGRVEAMA